MKELILIMSALAYSTYCCALVKSSDGMRTFAEILFMLTLFINNLFVL